MSRKKIGLIVRKTTYRRVESKTHTLERALKLEGHDVTEDRGVSYVPNPVTGDLVPLSQVELYIKQPNVQSVKINKGGQS